MSMKTLLALLIASSPAAVQGPGALPSFATPGISPDGAEIAFVSGGDIWTVPASGGEARLLVSHPAIEARPLYAPDGKTLAFTSTRAGSVDVWTLNLATGALRRLTFEDGAEQLDSWSPDGQWLYYSSSSRDIAGMNDVYKVRASGGTPMAVSADRYASEYWAMPSPDGRNVAITARGSSSGQWWRKGSSHIDQSQILIVRPGAPPSYQPVTDGGAREGWPMWTADGQALWYISDRGGPQNLWTRPAAAGGTARQVTTFRDGRVLWPSITRDGKRIAFERDFGVWTLETASGRAAPVPITLRGAGSEPVVERITATSQLQEMALSPDARKIAFVVRGEIFAVSARDGGNAARVTRSPAMEGQMSWAPDSRRLAYASGRSGALNLFLYDFTTGAETRLTDQPQNDVTPHFSPDGKQIAFVRDGRELRVLDMASRQERLLATGVMDREPFTSPRSVAWSPDGKWLAYLSTGVRGFTSVFLVPAAGGDSKQVTFLANSNAGAVSWAPSGAYLLVNTNQRTESAALARVDLVPRTPRFREDLFRDLFTQEAPRPGRPAPQTPPAAAPPRDSAPAPVSATPAFEFNDVRRRLTLIPVGVDVNDQVVSPDGKWVVMVGGAEGRSNLYIWPLDELSTEELVARQLTSTSAFKTSVTFSPDSKEVYYMEGGRLQAYHLDTRQTRPIAVTAEMEVDFDREKMEVFRQAWTLQRDNFYDPEYHGADWEAVRRTYEPRVMGARSPDELRRILGFMVGELNASHSGINPPGGGPAAAPTGRLGLRFDPAALEASGQLTVFEVIPLGPAAIAGIRAGERLLAVDGERTGPGANLDQLLNGKVGRRVTLRVAGAAPDSGRDVIVRPVNTGTEKGLLYRSWVEDRRAYVARASNGRLGYVHILDMGQGSLDQLVVDLDTENQSRDGVVIDIRNNNGGFVNAYALDIFTRRPYLSMQPRGGVVAPARSQLGQRAFERPTVLVTNQHSLSDAEDFTEGYRTLGLGTVVGEPTAGWIIFTSNLGLLDGTVMRMPFIRIRGSDGKDMELHPRPVDVTVVRPVGEFYSGRDSQLDQAVKTLLEQIGRRQE
ncbi:MAG: PDZ domain-containing protein [Gemmatimonadales bacterium]|nr:PDZ domain-containing protein [Gemmatimonadales bacterium]